MSEINGRPTAPADRSNNSNRSVGGGIASTLFNSAKSYVTNIGRSVRDVPTALGTALDSRGAMARGEALAEINQINKRYGLPPKSPSILATAPLKNIALQIAQVPFAVAGVKDTSRSLQNYKGTYEDYKRQQG